MRVLLASLLALFLAWMPAAGLNEWLLPQTVDNNFSPAASVHAVSPIPLLFIHGERDSVVPDAGHIQAVKNKDLRRRLTEFLRRHSGRETGAALN